MRNTDWFDGLKWAESMYQKHNAAVAEKIVDSKTFGRNDAFDRGARDYIIHHSRHLTKTGDTFSQVA
jgi:hypothetical protein